MTNRRRFPRRLAIISAATAAAVAASALGNSELDVANNGASDLTAAGTYTQDTAPNASSDVTFTASTVYTNTTFTDGSTLSIGTLNDLDATQTLTINNGTTAGTLTLNGGTDSVVGPASGDLLYVATGGTLNIGNGTSNTLGVSLAAAGNLDVAGSATISSIISGANGLTKTGAGTLTLTGVNTFTGAINVNGGVLSAPVSQENNTTANSPLGANVAHVITLNGGTFQLTGNNTFNPQSGTDTIVIGTSGGTLDVAGTGTITLDDVSQFTGNGAFNKIGTGQLVLGYGSAAYTVTSSISVSAGSLKLVNNGGNALGSATLVSVSSGAELDIDGLTASRPLSLAGTGRSTSVHGALTNSSASAATYSGAVAIPSAASIGGAGGGMITISGVISGAGALTKIDSNVLTLSGANSFSGGTAVSAGALSFLNTGALPGYPGATGGITVAAGATVAFGVGGTGSFTNADIANYLTGTNGITFSSNSAVGYDTTSASGGSFSASVLPTGAIGLTKVGTGILYVPSAASYTGNTTVYGGILSATDGTGLPAGSLLNLVGNSSGGGTFSPTSGSFTRAVGSAAGQVELTGGTSGFSAVGTAATINLGGAGATITWGGATFNPSALLLNDTAATNALSFQNGINLAGAVRTVTVNATAAGTAATLAGALSSASGGINKTGAGTLYVTNPANSYTGLSESSAGTLAFAGSGALPASSTIGLNTGTVQLLNDGLASNATISQGNNVNIIANSTTASTIFVGNNGSSDTGNTIALGTLNNQVNSANQGAVNFTGANGYLVSFTSAALPNSTGNNTYLYPISTSVIIGNVSNGVNGGSGKYDSLYFNGTSAGNAITGVIADATGGSVTAGNYTRLLVEGANTLTLTGASTYTGGTFVGNNAINTGTLVVNGSLGGTFVTVQGGGTLGGTGTIGNGTATLQNTQGTVVVAGGSTAATQGTINLVDGKIGALTIQGNSFATPAPSLTLGGTSAGTPSIIDLETNGTTNDEITLNGGSSNMLSLQAGGAVINIMPINSAALGSGTYPLLNFAASGSGIVGAFTLGSVPLAPGEAASLSPVTSTSTVENLIVTSSTTAGAINAYWTGSTSAVWNAGAGGTTGTNFTSDQAGTTNVGIPDSSTNVFFAATDATTANLNTTLGQVFTINSLSFIGAAPTATNAVTIGGSFPLTINAAAMFSDQSGNAYAAGTGIVVQAGVNATETISAPLVLGASQNWINNATGSTAGALTVSGGVTGTANLTLSANGTGNINFTSASVNNAGTITNAGTGTTTRVMGTLSTVTPLALGNIYATLGANVTGVFQNSATSDLVLGGNNSTYTGGITIAAGTLEISDYTGGTSTALGAATDVVTLGTTSAPAALDFNSRLSSVMAGATAVNGSATIAGLITVGGSGLDVISASDYAATFSGAVTLNNNLTVALPNSGGSSVTFTGGITGTGNITVSSENSNGGNVANFTTNPINFAGTITFNNASVNGGTAGTGTGTNTITGGVGSNVTGIIQASSHNPLTISGNPITVNSAGTTLTQSGTTLFTVSGGVNGTGALVLNNNNAGTTGLTISSTLVNNVGTITNSGTGSAGTTISAVVGTNVTGVTQNSSTSGLTLAGANVYAGSTTISAGYVQLTNAAGASTGSISIASGGELLLAAGSATYPNSITGAGYVEDFNGSAATTVLTGAVNYTGNTYFRAASTINFAPSSPSTLSGVIGSTTGGYSTIATVSTGSIIKSGSSVLTLSGNNLYTGSTTITGGTLLVSNPVGGSNSGTGTSSVTVTTGVIGGSGSIAGPASIGAAGTLSPGAGGSPAILTIGSGSGTSVLSFASNTSTYQVNITGAGDAGTGLARAGATYDSVNNANTSTTPLALASARLSLVDNAVASGTYDILQNAHDDGMTAGQFFTYNNGSSIVNLTNGSTFTGGANAFTIFYDVNSTDTGAGSDIVLVAAATPEPAALGLLAVGAGGLLARRRRRAAKCRD